MAYLGRRGALAPLTSADIPAGIVEGTDVAFLENASGTQNLSGTYSTERMYLNDSYTLTGNVTVNNHLALVSIANEDIVITNDGTERTITTDASGGTLEAGNVLQDTHRTSLTDMTGELGSAVIGSPNLNLTTGTLGSGVTYPAGHILQAVYATKDTGYVSTSLQYENSGSAITITPRKSTSKIVVQFQADVWYSGGGDYFDLQIRATGGLTNANIMHSHDTGTHITGTIGTAFHQAMTPVVNTTSAITFTMWIKPNTSGRTMYYPNDAANNTGINKVNILAWEVAQ